MKEYVAYRRISTFAICECTLSLRKFTTFLLKERSFLLFKLFQCFTCNFMQIKLIPPICNF